MKLLKIIFFFIVVYFVRRFIQMYRAMKRLQEDQLLKAQQQQNQYRPSSPQQDNGVINAEFKVID